MTARRALQVLALMAILGLGAVRAAAAPPRGSGAGDAHVTVLVELGVATRWDAWAAASRASGASSDALLAAEAAGAAIHRAAAPVERTVAERGGRVLARYDTAVSGMLVRLPRSAVDALGDLPSVARVGPAPEARLALQDSVPAVGAPRVWQELGISGERATIAIVDTGIDYTHAAFDGPGVEEAYAAAAAAAERIDDRWDGELLFPTARVVDGFDFAGPKYSPDCTPQLEAQGACTVEPRPDPDPLDTLGHGTTVADVAAGGATRALGPGVAPAARLVALKIFGNSNRTNLLLDPIEWAIEANMGEGGRPRIDVMNLSLGQPYGGGLAAEVDAIRRATDAGIVVVASAGNYGNLPLIASAPGIAPDALSVASYTPPNRHGWTALLAPAEGEPLAFDTNALYLQGWSVDPRGEITAPVVHVGRGCPAGPGGGPADPLPPLPPGAIALFDMAWGSAGPGCSVDVQARRLQDAGAAGALMGTGIGLPVAASWDAEPTVDIPVWMVNGELETALEELAAPGAPARLTLTPAPMPESDWTMSTFTSRGPGRNGALKPDLSAPGQGVFAAAMGHGHRGAARSGTSVAAPHASGAAALVWDRARALGRRTSARDVAATLIATADPDRLRASAARPDPPPLTRSGQGGVDAFAAVAADLVVRAGPLAGLDLGMHALAGARRWTRAVTVTNLADVPTSFDATVRFRAEADRGRGLDVACAPEALELAPGASGTLAITFDADPEQLPPWRLAGGEQVGDADALTDAEIDGWIAVAPRAGGPAARPLGVPFSLLARRASAITAEWVAGDGDAADGRLALRNEASFAGEAEPFVLGALDRSDPGLPGNTDLDAVGVRAWPDGEGNTVLEFALHARGAYAHPLETVSEIEIDTDLDGVTDYLVYTADETYLMTGEDRNGRVKVALQPPEGSPFGSPVARFFATVDLQSRWVGLPILAEDTGLTPSRLAFRYRVARRSGVERAADGTALVDRIPDDGGWLSFDARAALPWPASTVALGPRSEASTRIPAGLVEDVGLLVRLAGNVPGPADVAVLAPGVEPPIRLYVPLVRSRG